MSQDVLSAPHAIEYTYTRSTGPIIGAFLTALRDRRIVGVRAADGRVLVPPAEYDPVTSASLSDQAPWISGVTRPPYGSAGDRESSECHRPT